MVIKRALVIGSLMFPVSLITVDIGAMITGIDLASTYPANIPGSMWILGNASAAILGAAGSWWYFKSPETSAGAVSGLYLGLIACALGIVFDGAALLSQKNGLDILLAYFTMPQYWSASVLILSASAITGRLAERRAAANKINK